MILTVAVLLATGHSALEARIDKLIGQMTLEEKVSLCHGRGSFDTAPIPRLGIPSYKFSDGPSGVRYPWIEPATCFGNGVTIASTFNPSLINRVGTAIGEETLARGNAVILGPGVNIVRTPIGGRSFEYYGEDPWLARQLAIAYIKGVQSRGVAACVKHYAANSIEMQRNSVNAEIDERTLREIYLPAFEGAVKEGKVLTVMTAYNKINGDYCSENGWLVNDVLKKEWAFPGYVMSDWGGVHSTIPAALNGMDLEMPGGPFNFLAKRLTDAANGGQVPVSVIDDKVRRFLRVMLWLDDNKPKSLPPVGAASHLAVSQQVAEEGMVLLKNRANLLPLDKKKTKKVLVIGPDADNRMSNGGGSVMVNAADEITPVAGIKRLLGSSAKVTHLRGTEPDDSQVQPIPTDALETAAGAPGLTAQYYGPQQGGRGAGPGTPILERTDPSINFKWGKSSPADKVPSTNYSVRWNGFLAPKTSGTYFIGVQNDDSCRVSIEGANIIDNSDGWGEHPSVRAMKQIELEAGKKYRISINYRHHEVSSEMKLVWALVPGGVNSLIKRAIDNAKLADTVILVVGTNHAWDGEAHDKPNLGMFGDEALLTSEVLKAHPKTVVALVNGTAIEMPWINSASTVLEAWYGGSRAGDAMARVLFGEVNPSGKLPITFPVSLNDNPAHGLGNYPPKNGVLKYDEGILVGYRWFDTKHVAPLFPFGHGLSYTNFKYWDFTVKPTGQDFTVRFKVKNTGKVEGKETAQVYVRAKNSSVPRANQELKGFTKVSVKPGQSTDASVMLPRRAFAYWSVPRKGWVIEPGKYEIAVGSSSRDIRLVGSVTLK